MRIPKKISVLFFSSTFTILILGFTVLSSSENEFQQIIAKTNLFNLRFPQEKIYLHLDRSSYWADEDIWFKAYVQNSPIKECNLYVELVNPTGSVVYKNTAWVQNGLAYGDFHLANTLPSGIYQIRAYTNWMRNFDDVWFFRKDLVIWNVFDKEFQAESEEFKAMDIDLQFFPEAGTFIAGTRNKVAFKAIDNQGKGIDFEGVIIDDSGNKITDIKSAYKGIGSFVFQPERGRKYSAEVSIAGKVHKNVKLPKPKEEGVVLAINAFDPSLIEIQLIEKSIDPDKDPVSGYNVVGQSGGEICYHAKAATNKGIETIEIEKHSLPGGIIKFTLFDSNFIPVCERLVFNNHINVVNLAIKAEKINYLPREKVKIGLLAYTNEEAPCLSNLSMSVYNTVSQLKEEEYPNNIFTQFLLNSELKGNIENPAFYFKDDSLNTLLALDNLMLTHGYREFEWKEILEDEYPEIKYQPEPSIELKGKVISSQTKMPVVNGKITMMTIKSLLTVYEAETDSLGKFLFPNLYFYDTIYVSLKAVNKKGKNTTIIKIDSSSSTSPISNYLPYAYEYKKQEQIQTLNYLGETKSDLIRKKWSLSDTIQLDDVYVVARKREKDDGHPRIYAEADFVYDIGRADYLTGNIFESIEGRFPGVRYEYNEQSGGGFYARGDRLLIYMDGMEIRSEMIENLPVQMFDKVEYMKSAMFAGINYQGGVLFFYAKRGMENFSTPMKAFGMANGRIIGYSVSRKFYSPQYDTNEQAQVKEDYRPTIYWNPVVRTDSTGFAQVDFYCSDEIGDMRIIVEGVTFDGRPCRGEASYKVR